MEKRVPACRAKPMRNLVDLENEWKCLLDLGFLLSPVQNTFWSRCRLSWPQAVKGTSHCRRWLKLAGSLGRGWRVGGSHPAVSTACSPPHEPKCVRLPRALRFTHGCPKPRLSSQSPSMTISAGSTSTSPWEARHQWME